MTPQRRHLDKKDANAAVYIIDEELEEGILVVMYARVEIAAGEEILWNYNIDIFEDESDDSDDVLHPPTEGWLRTNDETKVIEPDPPDVATTGPSQPQQGGIEDEVSSDQSVGSSGSACAQAQGVVVNALNKNTAYLYKTSSPTSTNITLNTLLDNQAGISLFKNINMLSDIRKLKMPFTVKGIEQNGNGISAIHAGYFGPFGLVAISPDASSYVISVAEMVDGGFVFKYDPQTIYLLSKIHPPQHSCLSHAKVSTT